MGKKTFNVEVKKFEENKDKLDHEIIVTNMNKIDNFKNLSNAERSKLVKAIEEKDITQISRVIDIIKSTKVPEITEFQNFLENNLINYYIENKPDLNNPEMIHDEIKFFKKSQGKFNLLFANRLSLINKKGIYKKIPMKKPIKEYDKKINGYKEVYEKYSSFKNYVEDEFGIAERTAYDWIDISDNYFDMLKLRTSAVIENTKLSPSLPLLKSDLITDKEKKEIKKEFVANLDKTVKETRKIADDYKIKYHLKEKKVKTENIRKTSAEIESEVNNHLIKEKTEKQLNADKMFSIQDIDLAEKIIKTDNTDDWKNFKESFDKIQLPNSDSGKAYLKIIYDGLKKFLEKEGEI